MDRIEAVKWVAENTTPINDYDIVTNGMQQRDVIQSFEYNGGSISGIQLDLGYADLVYENDADIVADPEDVIKLLISKSPDQKSTTELINTLSDVLSDCLMNTMIISSNKDGVYNVSSSSMIARILLNFRDKIKE